MIEHLESHASTETSEPEHAQLSIDLTAESPIESANEPSVTEVMTAATQPTHSAASEITVDSPETQTISDDLQQSSPQHVELTITTQQKIYEPIIPTETAPLPSEEELIVTTETEPMSEDPSHDIVPIEDTPSDVPPSHDIAPIEEPTTVVHDKPKLAHLTISKTTVSESFAAVPSSDEKSPTTCKHTKTKPTSSVTIEEARSPTEELNVPLTPGMDSADQYCTQEPVWNELLQSQQQRAIASAAAVEQPTIESIEIQQTPERHEPHPSAVTPVAQKSPRSLIADRLRTINNQRSTHLSNVLHLATLSENITEEPIENRIAAMHSDMDNLTAALEERNTITTQTTFISIVETVSTWLETIECRVYLIRQNSAEGPSEKKVQSFTDLSSELQYIAEKVKHVSQQLRNADGDLVTPADKRRLTTLQSHVKAIEEVTKENEEQARRDLTRWNEYVLLVDQTTIYLHNLQAQFTAIVEDDVAIDEKLFMLDELELANREQAKEISRLLGTARTLARDYPDKELPAGIYGSHELSKNLENNIYLERNRLLQMQSLTEMYEQTLDEFAQSTLVADDLVEKPIVAADLDELQQEVQIHHKFFVNLSQCRSILESMDANLDRHTREQHADQHRRLYDRATSILEKAAERAHRLSRAASHWTVLLMGMRDEQQWLQVAQQRVPDLSAVTSADYDHYITMYQSLRSDISAHYAKQHQLAQSAARLQELCTAPHVEEQNNDSLVVVQRLRDEVNGYLRRLQSFSDTWTAYETLTDRLELWIKDAEHDIAQLQRNAPPTIEDMRKFWEIKIHYELHSNIRTSLGTHFEQAMRILPLADEMLQRQFLGQLDERWTAVSQRIAAVQAAVVGSIASHETPVGEKLQLLEQELRELQLNIEGAKGVLKTEDELNLYIERMQVLRSRTDIIGSELGRISLLPTAAAAPIGSTAAAAATAPPERIGDLFGLSHGVSVQIAEELEGASLVKDQIARIQLGIERLRRLQAQDARTLDECEAGERASSAQIEQATADAQAVSDELAAHWQEILELRQLLHTLPAGRLRVSVSPMKLERDIALLQDEQAVLESRCVNLLGALRQRAALWRRFERQLELVHQSVQETDYMVELLRVDGHIDYERLRQATERLEVSGARSIF